MAAGIGTRMRSETPKHLHRLLGRRMVDWVLDAVRPLSDRVVVVASPETAGAFEGSEVAVQERPLGTGDAVRAALGALAEHEGDVLVVSGDAPLLSADVLAGLVDAHRRERPAATVLSAEPPDPRAYGRIVRAPDGRLSEIVEAADATEEQRAIGEVGTSIYAFDAGRLRWAIDQLDPRNAQGELYLTDTVRHLVTAGDPVEVHRAPDASATEGVNTRAELAAALAALRERINAGHMAAGVGILDPATTWIDADVEIEADATIHPFTVLRGRTLVGAGAEIGPHAVVVDSEIGRRAIVGPFCYLRPGTSLGARAKAGTFVEIKNSRIGEGAKVPHLSYVGDAEIGVGSNIGAGGITVNFPHRPGRPKGRTTIGSNVRTGVHNAFVAPVSIGDDAWIAAGSVITDDVPPGSLAGFPPRQVTKEGYVYRESDGDD
jgi:bifunctional UDP-N-acetylglucosamine pyrophosphorylase/glucosamine-1-phosphate N-acetyltransferase